jgi:hypothetical protein
MVFPVEQNLGESGNSYGEAGYSETVTVTVMADGKTLATDQLTITWSNKGEDSDTYSVSVAPATTNPEVDAQALFDVTVSGTYSGDVTVDYGDGSQTTLSYDVSDSAGGTFGETETVTETQTVSNTYRSAGTYTVSAAGDSKPESGSGGSATITVENGTDSGTTDEDEILDDDESDNQEPANDGGQADEGADTNDDTPGSLPEDTNSGGEDGNSEGDDGTSDGEDANNGANPENDTPGRDLPDLPDIPSDLPGSGSGNSGNGGNGGPPPQRGGHGKGRGVGNDTPGGLPTVP